MNTSYEPFRVVNSYGAFGSVTRERFEIVLEGTLDEDPLAARWLAYEFPAKPGDPARGLPIVAPYHRRLDWLVWFAAMSSPERQPWLLHLVWKLLGNDRGARSLLANDPFPERPPRWIRASLWRYRFAPLGSGRTWDRERAEEWLRPVSREDADLRGLLVEEGLVR